MPPETLPESGGERRDLLDMRPQRRKLGIASERRRARQALEQNAGKRVLVGSSVDQVASDLFGRDVVDGADELAGAGEIRRRVRAFRQSKIGEEGPTVVCDKDVAGLDVTVNQSERVRCVECLCDRREQGERLEASSGLDASSIARRSRPRTSRIAM